METKKSSRKLKVKLNEVYTPREALNPLLPYLKKDWRIWECASGKGHIAKYLRDEGFKVIEGQDFFNESYMEETDIIITNPPYSNKDDFLERAYILGKPFAFLLPIESLGAKKRGLLYKEYGIQLIVPHERINFIVPSGKKSAWFPTAWFCWQLNLPRDLMFVELQKLGEITKSSADDFPYQESLIADKQNPPDIPKITQESYVKQKAD